jgi:hypothetical protein
MSTAHDDRPAAAGFSSDQWKQFSGSGFLQISNALTAAETTRYLAACEEVVARNPHADPRHAYRVTNVVTEHEAFRELIDHDRHIGFAYDLYGDQLQLVQSDLFIRPPFGVVNQWHIDGPRAVPFRVFSPHLPLKLRFGYWLTDVPRPQMANYVYLPGSHRPEYDGDHRGIGTVPGQQVVCGTAGTITIAHTNLWHRIEPNTSDRTRVTIFLTYAPSWIAGYYAHSPEWLATLNREQRIIMRPYVDGEEFIRPPREDLPLFHEPELPPTPDGEDAHKVRRLTRYERFLRGAG